MKAILKTAGVVLLFAMHSLVCAQDTMKNDLPYDQIPGYPSSYVAGNILSRMIDGLGFRYYWATEGLREEDLRYRPSQDGRTSGETLDHIYDLSVTILHGAQNKVNVRSAPGPDMSFKETRERTLVNLHSASMAVRNKSAEEIGRLMIIYKRGDELREFPIWHLINGPIADAMHHTGQVVAFRRASGNPINNKVNVFMGKTVR